jgi:hypothetical protein
MSLRERKIVSFKIYQSSDEALKAVELAQEATPRDARESTRESWIDRS